MYIALVVDIPAGSILSHYNTKRTHLLPTSEVVEMFTNVAGGSSDSAAIMLFDSGVSFFPNEVLRY